MNFPKEKRMKMSLTSTSKFVSLILRHKPETIGIQLDEHGWANVDELIAGISKTREFNREILEEIVWTDNKQRFTFNEDKTKIRANQGHSIPVDVELPAAIPPETLWHGTGEKYVASIDQQGLIPKGRLYVHLSSDAATATKVGSRHGKPVLYIVKTKGGSFRILQRYPMLHETPLNQIPPQLYPLLRRYNPPAVKILQSEFSYPYPTKPSKIPSTHRSPYMPILNKQM